MAYVDVPPADEASFQLLCRIYSASVPAAERKPPSALRDMLGRQQEYRFLLARDDAAGAPVAMAILFVGGGGECSLLEYLAVDPARRSAGVGTALFRHCAGLVGDGRPMLVEVDSPEGAAAGTAEQRTIERRIAFYRRVGCRRLAGLTYRLPLPGHPPPMGLFLCAPAPPTTPASVPRATVRRYLTTLYTRVYRQPADDPRLDAMLADLPDPVRLV